MVDSHSDIVAVRAGGAGLLGFPRRRAVGGGVAVRAQSCWQASDSEVGGGGGAGGSPLGSGSSRLPDISACPEHGL